MEEQIFARTRQFKEEAGIGRCISGAKDRGGNTLRLINPAL
jgi:hypothetical protein